MDEYLSSLPGSTLPIPWSLKTVFIFSVILEKLSKAILTEQSMKDL